MIFVDSLLLFFSLNLITLSNFLLLILILLLLVIEEVIEEIIKEEIKEEIKEGIKEEVKEGVKEGVEEEVEEEIKKEFAALYVESKNRNFRALIIIYNDDNVEVSVFETIDLIISFAFY